MFKPKSKIASLALLAAAAAATTAHAELPTTPGWHALPGTQIDSICAATHGFPSIAGNSGCPAITRAWNSGVFDTKRNRLIIWGGGHNDYYGNEIYALNLNTQTIERVTDPGMPPGAQTNCTDAIANGTQANSRHTYDGIEYVANLDKMFVFGGALACGLARTSTDTWLFDFTTKTWELKNPAGTIPRGIPGNVSAYDSVTGLVYLYDDSNLYSYDPIGNRFTKLSPLKNIGYHMGATIDPKRRKFLIMGYDNLAGTGKIWQVDISSGSSYAVTELVTTGGSAIVGAHYPGLEYDSSTDRIVAWGEDTPNVVWSLNVDTRQWTSVTYSGGPTPVGNGPSGRWRYSPASGVFVLANQVEDNIYVFRPATGGASAAPPADTQAPTAPGTMSASASGSSQVNLSWAASTDNVGVSGYRVLRCSGASCSPTSQVGTATSLSYADSGLAASTTYRYAVAAYDAAGNASTASTVVSATTSAAATGGSTSGDADFAARCGAAGVLKCVGFDNPATELVRGVNIFPDGSGTYRAGQDTSTKTSGAGALRFDLPPPPHAGANVAGRWTQEPNPIFGQTFSENSTFYVQFRQRLSPEMVVNSWADATWKTVIFHQNSKTCGSIELTTSNWYGTPLAAMNTECGAVHMRTTVDGTAFASSPPFLMQQGDFMACQYNFTSAANCFYWAANDWTTVYYKIHVGTWGQPNSTVEMWVAREGTTTYKQVVRIPNMTLHCNTAPCTASPGKQEGYNNLTFTPYMTAVASSIGPANGARMWIDELIVSTQPIAPPNGKLPAKPQPPSAVTVN